MQCDEGSELHGFHKGAPFTLKARLIVGADGAHSHIRRFAVAKIKEPKTYIAVQGEFELHGVDPYFTAIFAPNLTDFYGWIIPKNGTALVGIALPLNDSVLPAYEKFISIVCSKYSHIGNELRRNGAFIYRPNGFDCNTGNSRIALVGEAAGFISPSSAEGFSFALKSAQCLASALDKDIKGFERRYKRNCASLRFSILAKSVKSPIMYAPWIRRVILASGLQSL
jgi:flavin-dependent dehydrogenase